MTPFQLSNFAEDEKVVSAVGALIRPEVAIRLSVPTHMIHRAVFLFLEAIPTAPAEDFELQAEVVLLKSGSAIHALPASIAVNANASGLLQRSRITAFANVSTGANENLFVRLGNPLTNGSSEAAMSPQKLQMECDEFHLRLLGSRNTSNSFSGWRALLAVRSSIVPL